MRRRDILAGAIAAFGATAAFPSLAAGADVAYPKQPIRLVVPRSAGGVVDIVARLWAEQAKQRLGNIVIENQGGGGGLIGASNVAHAKPDGYTLLAGTTSELVITPAITPIRHTIH
jgi:tripartite-type tricarboxylate transporter receptor subunit TctC